MINSKTDNSYPIDINICALNIQGLKKFVGYLVFLEFCSSCDIIALTETWQETECEFQHFCRVFHVLDAIEKRKERLVGVQVG